MPPITDSQLRELRIRYQTTYTAYQSCVDALTALGFKNEKPSAELLENEAKSLRALNEARAVYREALLEASSQ